MGVASFWFNSGQKWHFPAFTWKECDVVPMRWSSRSSANAGTMWWNVGNWKCLLFSPVVGVVLKNMVDAKLSAFLKFQSHPTLSKSSVQSKYLYVYHFMLTSSVLECQPFHRLLKLWWLRWVYSIKQVIHVDMSCKRGKDTGRWLWHLVHLPRHQWDPKVSPVQPSCNSCAQTQCSQVITLKGGEDGAPSARLLSNCLIDQRQAIWKRSTSNLV